MMRRVALTWAVVLSGASVFAQTPPAAPQTSAPAPPQGAGRAVPTPEEIAARQRAQQERLLNDWPNLARYRDDNAKLAAPASNEHRVVFYGDSITDGWGRGTGQRSSWKPDVIGGISGQTTAQMVVRFRQDVVNLKPKVVVILPAPTISPGIPDRQRRR